MGPNKTTGEYDDYEQKLTATKEDSSLLSNDITHTNSIEDDIVNIQPFETKISPPIHVVFIILIFNNFLIFADRYIIPGATREFSQFIVSSNDSPAFIKESPDAGIGLLGAAFIGSYAAAVVVAAHLVHIYRWKYLILTALILFSISVLGSGLAYYAHSYWMLFSFRLLSGVSEAALAVTAPPMIRQRGGTHGGTWLASFLTMTPIGAAFGFLYSSRIANNPNLGWQYAFFFEMFLALPLIVAVTFIKDETNDGLLAPYGKKSKETQIFDTDDDIGTPQQEHEITYWEELKTCLSSNILIFISLAQAVYCSVVAALGTFMGSFILALGIVETEEEAAMMFGVAISLSGLIGSPVGGLVVDQIRNKLPSEATSATTLTALLPRLSCFLVLGILVAIPNCFVSDAKSIVILSMMSWTLIFCAQSGMQWAILLSMDNPSDQPNAMAFAMFTSHLLGDVPFPIAYGALKDVMAPQCNIDAYGEFVDDWGCLTEGRIGVRWCMVLVWVYMCLSPLFIMIACRYAKIKAGREMATREEKEGIYDNESEMEDEKRALRLDDIPEIS